MRLNALMAQLAEADRSLHALHHCRAGSRSHIALFRLQRVGVLTNESAPLRWRLSNHRISSELLLHILDHIADIRFCSLSRRVRDQRARLEGNNRRGGHIVCKNMWLGRFCVADLLRSLTINTRITTFT